MRTRDRVAWTTALLITILATVVSRPIVASAAPSCLANFREVPIPSLGSQMVLGDVALASATDGWAVGGSGSAAVVLTWNGSSWSTASLPSFAGGSSASGVAAISADDAWVVGSHNNRTKALLLHWNGVAWSKVAAPSVAGATSVSLQGASASGWNDVWAVGSAEVLGATYPITMHYNGIAWSNVSYPSSGSPEWLTDVAAFGGTAAWLSGHSTPGGSAGEIGIWNGASWANTFAGIDMNGVSGTSIGNVWVVGSAIGTGWLRTWTAHWNGSSWTYHTALNPGTGGHAFDGASSATGGQIWAVGWYNNQDSDKALAEIEANGSWTWVPTPVVGTEDTKFEAISEVGGLAVAVGSSWNRQQTALIETMCPILITTGGTNPQIAVADVGATVLWEMTAGAGAHSLSDASLGTFDAGSIPAGGVYTHAFDAAGTYTIDDAVGGTPSGTIGVRMARSRTSAPSGTAVTITWATQPASAPLVYDVEILKPGATDWRAWKTGVVSGQTRFTPKVAGTYRFRALVRSTLGPTTGFSPELTYRAT